MNASLNKVTHKLSVFRPSYWTLRKAALNNQAVQNLWLNERTREVVMRECPVCSNQSVYVIRFRFEAKLITKFRCCECGHLFSSNLKADLATASKLFNYEGENLQKLGQEFVVEKLYQLIADNTAQKQFNLLDFGVGGNFGTVESMRVKYPASHFYACDLYEKEHEFYFQTYQDQSKLGFFDGISSNAVVEHLDNTMEAWTYLNRLLKPVRLGGGFMVHAFPSQVNEDLFHWAIKIYSHECLFSKKSLQTICEKTGFELLSIKYFHQVQHPVFFFKKVSDCE